jgi:RimJ/RimL family protein N-acetyltransferase
VNAAQAMALDFGDAELWEVPEREKLAWVRAIRMHYRQLSRRAYNGMSELQWTAEALDGDVLLLQMLGQPIGAVLFTNVRPELDCTVHLVRWGSMPQEKWDKGCRDACRWFFERYPRAKRIDANIPGSSKGAQRAADVTGFRPCGSIPYGVHYGGEEYESVIIYCLLAGEIPED